MGSLSDISERIGKGLYAATQPRKAHFSSRFVHLLDTLLSSPLLACFCFWSGHNTYGSTADWRAIYLIRRNDHAGVHETNLLCYSTLVLLLLFFCANHLNPKDNFFFGRQTQSLNK